MNWKHAAMTVGVVLVAIWVINRFVPSIGAMIFTPAATAPAAAH